MTTEPAKLKEHGPFGSLFVNVVGEQRIAKVAAIRDSNHAFTGAKSRL
jgi:hypothetical protein